MGKGQKNLTILFVAVILLMGNAALADNRGLTVPLRADESKDALVSQTVRLYSKSYALVIGNDAYVDPWPRLSNAVKDARLVKEALEAKGFEVTYLTNLTARDMVEAFEIFFLEVGEDPEARLFVWYAGHGYSERGEGYLVPVDAPDPSEGGKFRRKALSLRRMGEYTRGALALHIFAVFDSCFAGTVFNVGRAKPPPAITRATTRPVRQFLTSGDAGQSVSDDGTFRKLFIRALNGETKADSNKDGYLAASELGLFLTGEVTNYSNGTQTPRSGKLNDPDLNLGDFIFQVAPPAEAPAVPGIDKEALFWQSIQGSENPEMYQAYIEQFPRGAFVSLARLKIEQFRPSRVAAVTRPPKIDRPPSAATPAVGVFPKKPKSPTKAKSFRDCPDCPEMVVIPGGKFRMGHSRDVGLYTRTARPVHSVTIAKSFAMSRYEVTFDEYDRFANETGRSRLPDKDWGRGRHPALRVPREHAIAYTEWLSEKSGKRYRLPTEAEWEFAARGGRETNFWWGDSPSHEYANYGSGQPGWFPAGVVEGRDTWKYTAPVGSFPPNPFGLYDMSGNVWEHVLDCYHETYEGAPVDGSARMERPKSDFDDEDDFDPMEECVNHVMRGGSWGYNPKFMMSASRIRVFWGVESFLHYGIRLVREMD